VLERAWAARAGLGFVGKNGLLIVPGQGSFCLLGEVVTTLALEAFGVPMGERCGSCRACLEACPTQAFDAPFVLDPRRCVSYATIEQRSPPAPASWESIGDHLFGCDVCQSVCPYNHVAPADPAQTAPFAAFERWAQLPLVALSSCDEAAWRALTEGSPLRRATRVGMAHNALLVAARRLTRDAGDEDARRALEAGIEHDDASVRGLAAALVADYSLIDDSLVDYRPGIA
jgi:epoxyqueuosine reductase